MPNCSNGLAWLDKQDEISFDLETGPSEHDKPEQALNPRKSKVIGIVFN
jgi:hypothetical protein